MDKGAKTLLIFFCFTLNAFETLQQARVYSTTHEEYPTLFLRTIRRPDYSSFYLQQKLPFFARFLESLSLYKPLWSPRIFKEFLKKVTQEQESKGYTGDYILINNPQPDTQFIIIGPLFGTFHSLVRDLTELEKRGFINNELRIIRPNCSLIFLGNVINGAPYVLETLTLVLSLMAKNPTSVFYIRGYYESEMYWQNTLLKQQLKSQADYLSKDMIPFSALLSRFFNTLPIGIYLTDSKKNGNIIRISYFSIEEYQLNEISCRKQFETQLTTMSICKLAPQKEEAEHISFKALIRGENRLISYQKHPGLAQLEPERGATSWAIFSSPSISYQRDFSFFYDVFALVTIGPSLSQTTITLYHQDIRDQLGFNRFMVNNVITGQSLLPLSITGSAFTALFTKEKGKLPIQREQIIPQRLTEILQLGSSMDLSKSNQFIGKSIRAGISAAVNRINRSGGVNGKQLQVTILDDEYTPALARDNIEKLIKRGINFILTPVGTPTLMASLDLIEQKKIFVLFATTGSPVFSRPNLTNIVHFRASYTSEAQALVYHAIRELVSRRFAFFYQDDSYGKSALEGAIQVLKRENIVGWTEVPYLANTVQVADAVAAVKKGAPDTIGLFCTTPAGIEFLRQLGSEFLAGKRILAISPLSEQLFRQFVKSAGLNVTFAQVVPNPLTSQLEIVREYREEIAKQAITVDTLSLEGYIAASLAAHYLAQIKGPITFKALSKVIAATKNYNFKGLMLDYSPLNQKVAHYLWIEQPNGEWIEQNLLELTRILNLGISNNNYTEYQDKP